MLTGDENIVDVNFSVLWVIKPGGVSDYVFNIQNPEGTVKAVAESAMREVIGRSKIEPVLTGARQSMEGAVQERMQKTPGSLGCRNPDQSGPVTQGRSADPGDRLVPQRIGRQIRCPTSAERGADLR
jgi:hypothetical protein